MQTSQCIHPRNPGSRKHSGHGPIMPALSNAMACASGATVLGSSAGVGVAVALGIAAAAFGFSIRYFEPRGE